MIQLSRSEFLRLARRAYQQLPPRVRQSLENVDVAVEEWPAPEDLESAEGSHTLLGLYVGVPLPERAGGAPILPDRIVLFRQPILQSCSTRSEVVREIRVTLWHEVGHYLGLDEADLHRLGYG
ncbi:MAG: metallopeptidase family protein [Dehalococcoidia bacterium]